VKDGAYNLVLSHRPEAFLKYVENGVDLALTGHAHGGQIILLGIGAVAPNQGIFPKYIKGMYEKVGYRCLEISARENRNIDQVRELVKDKTTLFTGHSGVGKSALINAIDPELKLRVGDVSEWSMKGKHTTTFAEIFPFAQGGYIIDTPGIKEFGMVNFSKEEISHFFPEMRNVLHGCRFANCTHEHEPSCAVKQAVADGIIDEVRYQNYINILNGREMELEDWETR
jgi:ribosome biogenesis GTPase